MCPNRLEPVVFRQLLVFGQGLYALESSGSELLTADMARRGKAAFGVAAFDFYSASEG